MIHQILELWSRQNKAGLHCLHKPYFQGGSNARISATNLAPSLMQSILSVTSLSSPDREA